MKIKLLFVFILILAIKFNSFAQTYGNEWINYSQKYYKFKILQDGIYKIDYQTLVNAGVPTTLFSSANMQVFGKDKEIPLIVFDFGDGSFDSGDYFFFYAEKNDGWLDSTLYEDPNTIGNPACSIFNDTMYYFFTWNTANNNARFSVENDNSFGSYTEEPYLWGLAETYANAAYNIAYLSDGIQLSQFSPGEGFASGFFGKPPTDPISDYTANLNLTSLYTNPSAPNATFHGKTNSNSNAGNTDSSFDDNHHLKWILGTNYSLVDTTFSGHRQIITNKNVPNNELSTTTNTKLSIVDDLTAITDYQSFSYMSLYYPRTGNFNGQKKDKFFIRDNANQKIHVKITNSTITTPIVMVLGGSSPKYIFTVENAGTGNWRALIPKATNGKDQQVIIQDVTEVISVSSLSPVTNSGYFTDYSLAVFDSSNLMIYNPKLDTASLSYKTYRDSTYNVIFANIEELYLQFGGGIPKHNAAIRRFAHYAYKRSTIKPVAITLLGKGYNPNLAKKDAEIYGKSLIPCFGNPGSDICYTANLEGSGFAPLIPIGRISVNTNTELSDYLNKLKTYEEQQNQLDVYNSLNKDWQKQIIHFSGGNPGSQADGLFSKMEGWRNIIEDYYYGGHVTSYRRISDDPLDPSLLLQLADQFESGVSLITFFGHSDATGFDISVDSPENWNNTDKYPVIIGNGCHAGDIYSRDDSFGELSIRIKDEGAIAYIGSSDQEYDVSLDSYTTELYNQFSNKNYGATLGQQIKNTIEYLQANNTSVLLKGTYGSNNLDGDPLIKLNWHAKPEIEITEQSLYFEPSEINLNVDTFELNLVIKNLGKSIVDTFQVEIKRNFPGTTVDSIFLINLYKLNYSDTVKIEIPLQAEISVGINDFSVNVDIPSEILEQDEEITNNTLTKSLFLKMDAIVPIYPKEFAVVPDSIITVKASTINPIAKERTYIFEMDTTDTYNSFGANGEYRKFTTTGLGGVKEVSPLQWLDENGASRPLICKDSMVYFWRTAVDSSVLIWHESSFQYIRGKEGWGQDHFFQTKNNEFNVVNFNRNERDLDFLPVTKLVEAQIIDNETVSVYSIDNQVQDYGNIDDYAIYLAVIDQIDLKAWQTIDDPSIDPVEGHYLLNNNHLSGGRPRQEAYFWYYQDSLGLNNLNKALDSLVPLGSHIVLYATKIADYTNWNLYCPDLYQTLADLGLQNINPFSPERAFLFIGQKGSPLNSVQTIATVSGEELNLSKTIISGNYFGYEVSPFIGPSTEWKALYWKQHPQETNLGDTTTLSIKLYNQNQAFVSQIDISFTPNDSIVDLSTLVDANQYPFIKLKSTYLDYVNFTPAQKDRWHVLYTGVPEAAIDGTNGYSWIPEMDTLNEGEEFQFAVDIKNISDYDMDSLLVSYWVEDYNHVKQFMAYPRQDSLRVNQVLRDTITVSTKGFPGLNSLWIEVNPYIDGSSVVTDQLEQYHFNNLLQIPFYVRGDHVNPILDVTFEGRHILNGDIVDPNSEILITLKDDNEFLIMDDISDTTLFGIFLTDPSGVKKKIPFKDGAGNDILQWFPAESKYKKFKIIYPAYFEQNGVYSLLVQGTDRSGNLSGDIEYKISFEVIHESTITYLMNYPNPFSTSTRFVFTLTGSEIPEEFLIQIMTVSGKVVRQITEDDLGPIYIGRNITDYAWDGTDDFGDPLANGVYIYRVLSRLNGEEIKHRESNADSYFTKEYGKMYIIR